MASVDRLIEIMARLRDPDGGCPWDIEQTFESIAPYTIEEAYEVAHAIERGDFDDLRDELGDLLLQVVYHARMAEEQGRFGFGDVVGAICDKLVRRHPHVFAEAGTGGNERHWERFKAEERAEKRARAGARGEVEDPLADIPRSQPALMRARKLLSRARAETGGECENEADRAALEAVEAHLRRAGAPGDSMPQAVRAGAEDAAGGGTSGSHVLGTVLLACVRAARSRGLDAEVLLREANAALESRVREKIRHAKR
jgi:ATP diphosphatase